MPRASLIGGASPWPLNWWSARTLPSGPCLWAASPSASLLHPQRAACLAGEELPDELVVRVEQLLGRAGFHDPPLPEDRDVLRHASGGHDVVRDDDVGAAVLLVDLLDQLTEEGGAHRVEARVRLVEQNDLRVEHEGARESGALAHTARQLVRHLVAGAAEADFLEAAVDDVLDLVLA